MRIAVVSPFRVPPTNNGARKRIERLTRWLAAQGHAIHFVWAPISDHNGEVDKITGLLAEEWGEATVLPVKTHPARPPGDDWAIDAWVGEHQRQPFQKAMTTYRPDAVVVNYIFLSRFLDWSPDGAIKYLDVHDRLSRRLSYEQVGLEPGFFFTTVEDELAACRRADAVLAIQDHEVEHFAASGRPVAVLGHPEPSAYQSRPTTRGSVRAGFVAAYNKFNAVSLVELLSEIERTGVLAKHDATLAIAGNLVRVARNKGFVESLPAGVEDVGPVSNLKEFYDGLDLIVNPTIVGTGLKIKTVEALAFGVALLSTSVGTDGLPVRSPFHACSDIRELVRRLDELLADPTSLAGLANLGRHIHAEYQLNLERNLQALFAPEAAAASEEGRLGRYLAATTGPLDGSDPATSLTLDDLALTVHDPISIVHVVNPVPAGYQTDLYSAQPVTFESMRRAARFARSLGNDVTLLVVAAKGDREAIPAGFLGAQSSAAVVTDTAEFRYPRSLPLVGSLLEIAANETDAEWLVYTNADIAVLPHFYTFIAEKIRQGHDAIVINRRTISRKRLDLSSIDAMYSEIGEKHPGYDCFVVKREVVNRFRLGNICIGVHLVGKALLWNVLAFSRRPLYVDRDHLTFHLGDDNSGKTPRYLDYIEHNTREAIDVLDELSHSDDINPRFERELNTFAPNLLNLRFDPRIISTADGALRPEFAERPIFIHALFRTGSTFVWNAVRRSSKHTAYYEPLHEELAALTPERLDEFRAKHSQQTWHRFDGAWLFAEYESLLEGGRVGVPGYRRQFAYESFADNSPQPTLRAYIDRLIQNAGRRQPVLQMNRSALRQRWFHREYPQGHHVYLFRHPREQWASYLNFMVGTARGFARNDAIICGMNRYRALIRPLTRLVDLVQLPDRGDLFSAYDRVFDEYAWEERYTIFYFLWLQSLLEAAATGSHIVDMNALSRSRRERMVLEARLAAYGAQVDLAGFEMTHHDCDLPLDPYTMSEIEERVHGLIVSSFGYSRVRKLEINPLDISQSDPVQTAS